MPAQDPFTLIDEIEKVLGLRASPFVWPIGSGADFQGIYDFQTKQVHWYEKEGKANRPTQEQLRDIDDPKLKEKLEGELYNSFQEGVQLAQEALPAFAPQAFLSGELSPLFFGSAVKNFGVSLFLDYFLDLCPPPRPIELAKGEKLNPEEDRFSAFVFKLQANMNRKHRDRIAFVRITSGAFSRGHERIP